MRVISALTVVGIIAVAFMQKRAAVSGAQYILVVSADNQTDDSQLILFDAGSGNTTELTTDFVNASGVEISSDGKRALFSGRLDANPIKQIYEINIESKSYRQITDSKTDCEEPMYLPGSAIAYIKKINQVGVLHKNTLAGDAEQRITFHPHSDSKPTLLKDGRILVFQQQDAQVKPLALRPDGTKAGLFAKPIKNFNGLTKAWEGPDGKIFFAIQRGGNSRVMSFHFNDPTATERIEYTADEGPINALYPLTQDSLLIADYNGQISTLSVLSGNSLQKLSELDAEVTEVVGFTPRFKAKNLPSRIVENDQPGIIMNTGESVTHVGSAMINARIQRLGGATAQISIFEDGSFYARVPSNEPLKIITSEVESDWFWVRPGERRGCIGCHVGSDYVPANKVPLAVKKAPEDLLINDKVLTE